MSVHRKKSMSDFEFYQTQYLGGRVSAKDSDYKRFALKDGSLQFAKWLIENMDDLSRSSPEEALAKILEIKSKIEYLKGMTEVSHLAMNLGQTEKRSDAHNIKELLKRARDGIKTS
jgi:hypothetical protein